MKVLHINTVDRQGGAARAMMRLHTELLEQEHQSRVLVGRRVHDDSLVKTISEIGAHRRSFIDRVLDKFGGRLARLCGIHPWIHRSSLKIPQTPLYRWADILDLRNLHGSYFNLWGLPNLTKNKPTVWRVPDMWAFTGHCAYSYDCERWQTGCHHCPLLIGESRNYVEPRPTRWDCTKRIWYAKRGIFENAQLHIVITTEWMKQCVEKSILKNAASVTIISNGVDLDIFKPMPREEVRRKLGLPLDKPIALFASAGLAHYRKGYRYAAQAIQKLQASRDSAPMLITMGHVQDMDRAFPLRDVRHFGFIKEEAKQALLYAAADVFLCTTLADGQPQVALEALACGTPIVAFDVGPMPELARPGKMGYLAHLKDSEDLANGIHLLLENDERRPQISHRCRMMAEQQFDLTIQTTQYISLFEQILQK